LYFGTKTAELNCALKSALNDALPSGYESVPELKAVLQSLSLSLKSGFEHADTPQRAHLTPPTPLYNTLALLRSSDFYPQTMRLIHNKPRTAVKGLIVDTVGSHEMATQ